MNDLLDPAAVEDRLRRTLSVRAEDMRPGDGAPSVVPLRPTLRPSPRRRRFPTTIVLTAAALAVVAGAAVALLWPDDSERVVSNQDPDGQEDPAEPTTETTVPSWSWLTYGIAQFETAGSTVNVAFESGAGADMMAQNDFWEEVEAGPNRGYYAALPNGSIGELRLVFADGTVSLMGGAVPREELMAAAATVRFDPATGMYTLTPPLGWTVLSMTTPEDLAAMSSPQLSPPADPVGLGSFACEAAPTTKTFGAIWYPGWTRDNFPDDATSWPSGSPDVELFSGTIAPMAGDLFQVWIVYADGVVELQGVAMTEAELVEAAGGVERLPDGNFQVTPPPCFVSGGG